MRWLPESPISLPQSFATSTRQAAGLGCASALRSIPQGSRPIEAEAEILFLLPTDNPRERQAVVKIEEVTVVLTAARRPFHNISDFTRLQLHIPGFKLLVVKSGYLVAGACAACQSQPDGSLRTVRFFRIWTSCPRTSSGRRRFLLTARFSWQPSTIVSARSPRETR